MLKTYKVDDAKILILPCVLTKLYDIGVHTYVRRDLLLEYPAFAQRGGKFSLGSRDSCITVCSSKAHKEFQENHVNTSSAELNLANINSSI